VFPALVAALRGVPGVWRELDDPVRQQRFLEEAGAHRVKPLLVWALSRSGDLPRYPDRIRDSLLGAARAEGALEIARQYDLCRVLSAFSSAGVDVLLIKGAALAYTVYPEPWLRPREDTDLLVRAGDAVRAGALLGDAGYHPVPRQSGRLVTNQQLYVRTASPRREAIDLHWKIADPAPFADLLSCDELFGDASAAPVSGSCVARGPSRGHALLLACWHRVAHHRDAERMLWLYDMHLLAGTLDAADRRAVVEIAARTRTADVCAGALTLVARHFESAAAAALLAQLAGPTAPAGAPASRYLRADARKVDLLVADLQALPGWRARAQLLKEHLFPPAAYMRETYPHSSPLLLPFLYARRIAGGARRWFERPR
jgi:hypothetical protein